MGWAARWAVLHHRHRWSEFAAPDVELIAGARWGHRAGIFTRDEQLPDAHGFRLGAFAVCPGAHDLRFRFFLRCLGVSHAAFSRAEAPILPPAIAQHGPRNKDDQAQEGAQHAQEPIKCCIVVGDIPNAKQDKTNRHQREQHQEHRFDQIKQGDVHGDLREG